MQRERGAVSTGAFCEPTVWRNTARTYWGYAQLPPEILRAVAGAYREVFSGPPWNENWPVPLVVKKVLRELAVPAIPECREDTAFLTVIDGNSKYPVGGFSWGAVVDLDAIVGRVVSAHRVPCSEIERLKRALTAVGMARFVFTDEIGILPRFRGGGLPVAQLCYPTTVVGSHYRLPGVCWSSETSRIVPFLRYYHYQVLSCIGDILFLYSPPGGVAATKRAIEEFFVSAGLEPENEVLTTDPE